MKMQFNQNIAAKVGTDAAIIFEIIADWENIRKPKIYNKQKYRRWSAYELHEILWHLSVKQIRTCFQKLIDFGYISTENLNQDKFDKTLWYAINLEV